MELGNSSADEYNTEMTEAKEAVSAYIATMKDLITIENVVYLEDVPSIAEGRDLFLTHCSACYLEDGRGEIGPNLTGKYWLNRGDVKSIFKVVRDGKKELPSWESTL
tara:strand:- start:836 stop:1156 length:321 start_codon:yes stop_codon:yes gene_type:complete